MDFHDHRICCLTANNRLDRVLLKRFKSLVRFRDMGPHFTVHGPIAFLLPFPSSHRIFKISPSWQLACLPWEGGTSAHASSNTSPSSCCLILHRAPCGLFSRYHACLVSTGGKNSTFPAAWGTLKPQIPNVNEPSLKGTHLISPPPSSGLL